MHFNWPAILRAGGSSIQNQKKDDTIRTVYIWHSDTLRESKKILLQPFSRYSRHVKLQQGKHYFMATASLSAKR